MKMTSHSDVHVQGNVYLNLHIDAGGVDYVKVSEVINFDLLWTF